MVEFKSAKKNQTVSSKVNVGKSSTVIIINKIKPKDGWEPLPRRDHACMFFKAHKYFIIFGGRTNDKISTNGQEGYQGLNEILLFDILKKEWQCFSQLGFAPSGRWSAALAVSELSEQIFVFGGSNN
jgi:Galactose oxidase, central domain